MYDQNENNEVAPSATPAGDMTPEGNAVTVDIDLGAIRSQLVGLRCQSMNVATELLAVLGPLERRKPPAIEATTKLPVEIVELTRL